MNVGVCYAEADRQTWLRLEVPDESTVQQAIELSGLLTLYPTIDLTKQKVGIFGKLTKLDALIKDGDRVEIYRPITADPTKVKRRRVDVDDDDDDD
ncbi:RnfH family protein [Methylomonas sp. MgM2]